MDILKRAARSAALCAGLSALAVAVPVAAHADATTDTSAHALAAQGSNFMGYWKSLDATTQQSLTSYMLTLVDRVQADRGDVSGWTPDDRQLLLDANTPVTEEVKADLPGSDDVVDAAPVGNDAGADAVGDASVNLANQRNYTYTVLATGKSIVGLHIYQYAQDVYFAANSRTAVITYENAHTNYSGYGWEFVRTVENRTTSNTATSVGLYKYCLIGGYGCVNNQTAKINSQALPGGRYTYQASTTGV